MEKALTAEEWAQKATAGDKYREGQILRLEDEEGAYVACTAEGGHIWVALVNPHGAAALCLHDQPFGFTEDDLDLLNYALWALDELEPNKETQKHMKPRLRSLKERVEALLPPEDA